MNLKSICSVITVVALVLAINTSCSSKAGSGALIGAGGGAAAGAGIGAAVGGKKGAVIGAIAGAGAGAITGSVIGHYMDKQEAKMREKVKQAEIKRQGDTLLVKFPSGILFDVNKSTLKSETVGPLSEFAQVVNEFNDTTLFVEGHTDSSGAAEYNQVLSEKRADSVVGFLASKSVTTNRLTAVGYGEDLPLATNATAEGRKLNRRVEIKIIPSEELREQSKK